MKNAYKLKELRAVVRNKLWYLEDLKAETKEANDQRVEDYKEEIEACAIFLIANLDDLNKFLKEKAKLKYSFKTYREYKKVANTNSPTFFSWVKQLKINKGILNAISRADMEFEVVRGISVT
jgi:hypothetical protein